MLHVSYGLFDDVEAARAAIDAIEAIGTPHDGVDVTLHRDRLDEGLLHAVETGAPEGRRIGAAFGAVAGAIAGAAVTGPAGLLSGGALGALYGGVAGTLGGASGPDRTLERLSGQLAEGKALLVVETSSFEARDAADDARSNGRCAQSRYRPSAAALQTASRACMTSIASADTMRGSPKTFSFGASSFA